MDSPSTPEPLNLVECGRLAYGRAMELQQALVEARQQGRCGDWLLLLEHPPVITLGRNAKTANILLPAAELRRRGIEVAECNRGGDVTFHGPGQLVGYPILDLRQVPRPAFLPPPAVPRPAHLGLGAVEYVRALEQVLIDAAAELGVPCRRECGRTGAWTQTSPPRKLAAIGVHIARAVTSHGFALNLDELEGFQAIVPCGLADYEVTSLRRETGAAPEPARVRRLVSAHFARVFGRQLRRRGFDELLETARAAEVALSPVFVGP